MRHATSTLGILALSTFAAAAFLACNSGSDDLTPEEQIAAFCDDTVAPICEAYYSCCTDPVEEANVGKTLDECKTTLTKECSGYLTTAVLPQIEAGTTALDESRLATCVSKLEDMKSDRAACATPPLLVAQHECFSAFQGTIAPGEACSVRQLDKLHYIPCQDGTCEDGKCKAFLATGAACDPSQDSTGCNIVKGEWCIGTGTAGKCGPRSAVGESCGAPGEDRVLSCASMSCGSEGKCVAPTASGVCVGP
jgi:hypothetical protein